MNILEKLTHYLLPKHLRNNPLHPEYEERYSVIRMQLIGILPMFAIICLLYYAGVSWAPYFFLNTVLWCACLAFSPFDLLQEANVANAFFLYFLYFPMFLHTGGIYSINLIGLYPMLFANMYTHRKWGIYFIIPALFTVWLLCILTPDSPLVSSVMGSRLYVVVFHSIIIVSIPAVFVNMEKKRNVQITENKTIQNNTIHSLSDEVARRTKELNSMKQTLAADFHDETGNMLSAIIQQAALLRMQSDISTRSLEIIDHIIANSNQLYASSRHFIWNLNNDSDDPGVLFNYLTSFGQLFYNQFDIAFSVENEVTDSAALQLEAFAAINLIFIFKEAMTNIVKHADAKEVIMQMTYGGERLHFSLADDGKWKEPDGNTDHHGLNNIKKRCAEHDFLFTKQHIDSIGTRITVAAAVVVKSTIQTTVV